jgi:hypothetical protein
MAEHNALSDRELGSWLVSLSPRRSRIDRERLLYEAGRAAALTEYRHWRPVSLAGMASGWLAAAVILGMSWTPRSEAVTSGVAQRADAKRPASAVATVSGPTAVSADVRDGPQERDGFRQPFDTTADLRQFSRTGRLPPDAGFSHSIAVGNREAPAPRAEMPPQTYFHLRRSLSHNGDVL